MLCNPAKISFTLQTYLSKPCTLVVKLLNTLSILFGPAIDSVFHSQFLAWCWGKDTEKSEPGLGGF